MIIAKVPRIGIAMALIAAAATVAAQDEVVGRGSWAIRGTAVEARWIEIHQVEKRSGVELYHIEVLGRKKGNPS